MTGTIIVVAIGLLLFGWVLNLIRKGSVYVGYGSPLLIAIGGVVSVALVPARFVEPFLHAAGTVLPPSVLIFLVIYCVLLTLLYVLREITAVSQSIRALTQQLAIELAKPGSAADPREPLSKARHQSRNAG